MEERATIRPPVPEAPGFVLEEGKRLSASLLWRLQRESYTRRGEQAWLADRIPSYITSNPFIASAYAQVLVAFLRDCAAAQAGSALVALDPHAPFYVLELAAGSGQFAFLLLKTLLPLLRETPALADVRFRYVMSDLAPANVEAWRARDRLEPFVKAGLLDFATFDLERDPRMTLVHSGETLCAETMRNPLAVVANYAFDTTTQDAFWIKQGRLHEGLVTTLSSRREAEGLPDPELLDRVSTRYEQRPVANDYYEDAAMNQVLASYARRLGDTSLLFPIGALKGIRGLIELSGGRLLLLSGDKGYAHEDELIARGDPQMAVHAGRCFSMMVNYHAIGLYFRERGGLALHSASRDKRLKVSALLLGGAEQAFAETGAAFRRAIDDFGPSDYFALASGLRKDLPKASLDVILALAKLGACDPHLVYHFSGVLAEQARQAPASVRHDLMRALEKCWDHFYPMDQDLPFELGRIFAAMERPADALRFYVESLKLYGEHPATLFNAGLCRYRLQQPREALALMQQALDLKEDYAPAREWRLRIQGELGGA